MVLDKKRSVLNFPLFTEKEGIESVQFSFKPLFVNLFIKK